MQKALHEVGYEYAEYKIIIHDKKVWRDKGISIILSFLLFSHV